MYSYIIKNGLIVDGTNEVPYSADIAVKNDTIVKIGCIEEEAEQIIDVQGKIVTPGFIDIHCHSDAIVFFPGKNEKRLRQGFTTELTGNCGISAAPVNSEYKEMLEKYCDPYYSCVPLPYNWNTFGEYLDEVEKNKPVLNTAAMIGHGSLRIAVSGFENRKLTEGEMEQMKCLLREALEDGAFGLSTGLIYPPGIFADEEEILELAKVVKEYDGMYASHMRSESGGLIEAVQETIKIARFTEVNTEISHHKANGKKNHGKVKKTLEIIAEAQAEGIPVHCDVYPYDAASTNFNSVLPPWAMEGGVEKLLLRLEDQELRARMIRDMKNEEPDYESFYQLAGWDKIIINECEIKAYEGKTVEEIACMQAKDPFETALDIIKESRNNVMMIIFSMDSQDVARVLHSPYSILCTDGFASPGKTHPRYFSSFIRVLEKYVKEEHLLSLPEAIYKMTKMPADKIGISDRGRLLEGCKADILVLDLKKIHDNSNYNAHDALADGVDYVMINGQPAVEKGVWHPICAGKVLRRK
ncbi:N-acyl-D-amino-acid deacylase family protein [Faecalicatena orotica]|uniref:N-acyl-D-amino-acid deacylase family protein n=1 Tax=Faecalicatena orotica TaxID=1544 RepID=UPI00321704F5